MFARLSNLFRGMIQGVVSDAERANPEALLAQEREELRVQIAKFNEGLTAEAARAERLAEGVERQEREEARLRDTISGHLRAGNRAAAGEAAVRHRALQSELEENRRLLMDANTTLERLVQTRDQAVAAAKEKLAEIQRGISDVRARKAAAELDEMSAALTAGVGSAGESLNRLEEMVNEGRDRAAGRARVAQDALDAEEPPEPKVDDAERADRALADFAAEAGIVLEPDDAPESSDADADAGNADDGSRKTMGPVDEAP